MHSTTPTIYTWCCHYLVPCTGVASRFISLQHSSWPVGCLVCLRRNGYRGTTFPGGFWNRYDFQGVPEAGHSNTWSVARCCQLAMFQAELPKMARQALDKHPKHICAGRPTWHWLAWKWDGVWPQQAHHCTPCSHAPILSRRNLISDGKVPLRVQKSFALPASILPTSVLPSPFPTSCLATSSSLCSGVVSNVSLRSQRYTQDDHEAVVGVCFPERAVNWRLE